MSLWCSGYHYCTKTDPSKKSDLRICVGSNPARGVSEIRDGEDLWQWSGREIKLRLSSVNHTTKQFIIFMCSSLTLLLYICKGKLFHGRQFFNNFWTSAAFFSFSASVEIAFSLTMFFFCTIQCLDCCTFFKSLIVKHFVAVRLSRILLFFSHYCGQANWQYIRLLVSGFCCVKFCLNLICWNNNYSTNYSWMFDWSYLLWHFAFLG